MSHVQCCIQKFFFHDCLRFVFFITEFIWINKQSQSIFDMQNPTDGIVDIFHTDFTGFYQFFHVFIIEPIRHIHVDAGIESQTGSVFIVFRHSLRHQLLHCFPIAYHKTIEIPLPSQ